MKRKGKREMEMTGKSDKKELTKRLNEKIWDK